MNKFDNITISYKINDITDLNTFLHLGDNNKMLITNTQFRKQEHKLFTRLQPGKDKYNITHATHYQIDHIMVQKRWRNGILNVEADGKANIDSDHYPLWAEVEIALKAIKPTTRKCRPKIGLPTEEEKEKTKACDQIEVTIANYLRLQTG